MMKESAFEDRFEDPDMLLISIFLMEKLELYCLDYSVIFSGSQRHHNNLSPHILTKFKNCLVNHNGLQKYLKLFLKPLATKKRLCYDFTIAEKALVSVAKNPAKLKLMILHSFLIFYLILIQFKLKTTNNIRKNWSNFGNDWLP